MIRARRQFGAQRHGMTLLETMLSVSILAVLALTLSMAMESQVRLLRLQEGASGNGVAATTAEWIGARIRGADTVQIVNSERLTIVSETVGGLTTEQIYKQGDRLILETSGTSEEVAGPISAVNFADPDARGVSVSVTVQIPAGVAGHGPQSFTRVYPRDWIRS